MDFKVFLQQIQTYLENSPLIILGSGSSASYGLPLMGELKDEILSHPDDFPDKGFSLFSDNLRTMNLEEAMDKNSLSEELNNHIRKFVWKYINNKDFEFYKKLTSEKVDFAIVDLLKKILQPTPNSAVVITTNYDRLVEYAADIVEATIVTGFEGSLIRKVAFPTDAVHNARIRARERTIRIWKVHGSLDWFANTSGNIISYPMTSTIPLGHTPLIIPPGKNKFVSTHNEPFRDIISHADNAFLRAGSFICIGYGFNDEHIQPKLIEQIKSGKPIVVLCREATEACKRNIVSDDVKKYAIIECCRSGKTAVTCSLNGGKTEEFDTEFWDLPNFLKTVWG
jgi:hypothetical protein